MNELIKELWDEVEPDDKTKLPSIVITTEKELQEFAELIVKECIDCIDLMEKIAHAANAGIPKDHDKHTYLETLDTARGLLKTHFGVK